MRGHGRYLRPGELRGRTVAQRGEPIANPPHKDFAKDILKRAMDTTGEGFTVGNFNSKAHVRGVLEGMLKEASPKVKKAYLDEFDRVLGK